jgi:hypothetical protein
LLKKVLHRRLRDQAATPDDDQPVGRDRHLTHQVAGEEDGTALGRERLQKGADPEHALGVETVDRLVEQHDPRIAEQRRGDAQTLPHPEREAAHARAGDLAQPHQIEHLIDPSQADAVAERQAEEVVVGAAPRMHRFGIQQRPDLEERTAVLGIEPPVDEHPPGGWPIEAEYQAHRRRLARPVRTEKSRHLTRWHGERQVVHGHDFPVPLAEADRLDHPRTPWLLVNAVRPPNARRDRLCR